jgi:hypothetical protein
MSIQRHYDGKELASIYINGDELEEFMELIARVLVQNYSKEYIESLESEFPNVFPVLDQAIEFNGE